ncbi:hypothetical protein, partial [Methylobacterium sp. D54C]
AADAREVEARAAAVAQERDDRGAALAAAADGLAGRLTALAEELRAALRSETRARTGADAEERETRAAAVAAQARALTDAVADLETRLARKAEASDLARARAEGARALEDARADQAAALVEAVASVRDATESVAAALAAQRLDFVAPPGRPGDAPARYTFVARAAELGGPRAALPPVPAALVAGTENGPVLRVAGAGLAAGRAAQPLEPGRLYRLRWVVQRRVDPADPSGDAILCGAVFLDWSLRVLDDVVPLRVFPALTAAFGRQESEALVARTPGLGAAVAAPPRARFLVPAVATFGPDAVTDIEVLDCADVTGAFLRAPPPDGLEARIADGIAGLAARVRALEQAAGTPGTLTFAARGEAEAAAIPEAVQVVALLGRRYPGDGGDGLFVRVDGAAPAGAETFTAGGALFRRVPLLPDLAAATLADGFAAFMAGLPTAPPPRPGAPWNDNGTLAVTP